MKKRPLSIRILATLFLLSPIGLLIELMYLYEIPIAYWTKVFYFEFWTWQIFAFVILTPLTGLLILTARKWAFMALVAFTILILVNNAAVWLSGLAMKGTAWRVTLTAGILALVLIELRKEFYAPYFNPRLRWWEQAHRYATDKIRLLVEESETRSPLFEASSFDVSDSGVYVVSENEVKIGDVFALEIMLPGDKSDTVSAEVVWIHGGNDSNPKGFGCRFLDMDRYFKKEIRSAVAVLRADLKQDR